MKWWLAAFATASLPALTLSTACADDVSDGAPHGVSRGAIVDSAGVAVWSIPGDALFADLRLERIAGFAMPDTGWAVWPDGIAVNEAAREIYVLDESTPRVLVFDFDGKFDGQVGRKGQGPGEYDDPVALDVTANGDLLVMDLAGGVVHRWSSQQEYLGRDQVNPGYWGPGFSVAPRGLVYTTAGSVSSGTMIEALVAVTSSGVDTLGTVASEWQPLEMPCGLVPVPEVF